MWVQGGGIGFYLLFASWFLSTVLNNPVHTVLIVGHLLRIYYDIAYVQHWYIFHVNLEKNVDFAIGGYNVVYCLLGQVFLLCCSNLLYLHWIFFKFYQLLRKVFLKSPTILVDLTISLLILSIFPLYILKLIYQIHISFDCCIFQVNKSFVIINILYLQ